MSPTSRATWLTPIARAFFPSGMGPSDDHPSHDPIVRDGGAGWACPAPQRWCTNPGGRLRRGQGREYRIGPPVWMTDALQGSEARRHRIPRARYRVTNWPGYDGALQRRGSLTVWVAPEALAAWHPPGTGRRARSPRYAAIAIETGHLLRLAFGRPWRQTEGLLRSLATLLGLGVGVPDHTTFSRRSPGLALAGALAEAQRTGPVHVVIDATGLKVYGAGEWRAGEEGGGRARGRGQARHPAGTRNPRGPPPRGSSGNTADSRPRPKS